VETQPLSRNRPSSGYSVPMLAISPDAVSASASYQPYIGSRASRPSTQYSTTPLRICAPTSAVMHHKLACVTRYDIMRPRPEKPHPASDPRTDVVSHGECG